MCVRVYMYLYILSCDERIKKNSEILPYIIYVDIESLIKKFDGFANSQENSSTTKIGEHIPCEYSMSTIWAFNNIENKHSLCGKSV